MLRLLIAMLCIGAAGSSLAADTVIFDPDGSGNSPAVNMNTFQFGAGNSLFQNAIPFTQGNTFQLFFQAQLNSIVNGSSVQITPLGLNASGAVGAVAPFEITVVGSVTENVTNVNNTPARVLYRVAGTQATTSFIELYYDGTQNANALAGTGYNDGRLILRGVPNPPSPDVGSFPLNNPQATTNPNFDSFSTNDYLTGGTGNTNLTSISGMGATTFAVTVTFVDAAFFVAPGGGNAAHQVHVGDVISLDISHSAPFDKVDPSRKFDGTPNTGTGSGAAPAVAPRLGTINGASGPDFQAQSIAAASIRSNNTSPTPTPTPGGSPTPTPTVTPTPTPGGSPTPTPSATPVGLRVVVTANKSQVREGGDAIVTFEARGATSHPALTVNYSVGGTATLNTDYTLTPNVVVIPANAASASITLHANTDTVNEPDGETAKIVVEPGTGYDVPTQTDAKRVVVSILDPGA